MTAKMPAMLAPGRDGGHRPTPGPYRADQIRSGEPCELSNGHRILSMGTGRRGSAANLIGGEVLETDPAVKSAGVDLGFSRDPLHLRAPDVSVGDFANEPGWDPNAPPLAVEYADTGQDEAELKKKIAELLAAGTKHVWVVRLTGPRRVEVHEKGRKVRLAKPGDTLVAPGILQNPVPVLALYDRDAAHEATLRNLLQRRGYESLDAVRTEGKLEGSREGEIKGRRDALLAVLAARGLAVSEAQRARILEAADVEVLDRWLVQAVTAKATEAALAQKSTPARKPRP
jgi:Putative restriction endonuclease